MLVDDFRARLINDDEFTIVDEVVLAGGAAHVTDAQIFEVAKRLSTTFGCVQDDVSIYITGSAKLGFSMVEKVPNGGTVQPRYRPFGPESDIDISVISSAIFDVIWEEVGQYAARRIYFPPKFRNFGNYLVAGWVRPDQWPRKKSLIHANAWWQVFEKIKLGLSPKLLPATSRALGRLMPVAGRDGNNRIGGMPPIRFAA